MEAASRSEANSVWEHFSEDDDRMRTSKQLCKTDPGLSSSQRSIPEPSGSGIGAVFTVGTGNFSQGCLPASLYSPEAFQVPNGFSLPYVVAGWVSGSVRVSNPYESTMQSRDLREIETQINPIYKSKNDTIELNADYQVSPSITFTSQTGLNTDSCGRPKTTIASIQRRIFSSGNPITHICAIAP